MSKKKKQIKDRAIARGFEKIRTKSKKGKGKGTNKKRSWILILLLCLFGAFSCCVAGHFIYSCSHKKEEEKKIETHKIKVLPIESSDWLLVVNGKPANEEIDFELKFGQDITVVVQPKSQLLQNGISNAGLPVIHITDQKGEQAEDIKILEEQEHGSVKYYYSKFQMNYDYDIVIQVTQETDFEDLIYTKSGEQYMYFYDTSIYDITKPIRRYDALALKFEEIERKDFQAESITIGKRVPMLFDGFLSQCTSFNGNIDFQADKDDVQIQKIGENFLNGCTSFNKTINFPTSLKEVTGNFLVNCTSFNNGATTPEEVIPFDTKNVEHFDFSVSATTAFMFNCTSFNQPINFGEKLVSIPQNFLMDCTSFSQDITIPSTIQFIYDGFLFNCDAMNGKTITINCPVSAFINHVSAQRFGSTMNPLRLLYPIKIKGSTEVTDKWLSVFKQINDPENELYRLFVKAE